MNNRRLPIIVVTIIGFIVLMCSSSLFYTVQSTERCTFYPFTTGLDRENVIDQGFHGEGTWNTVYTTKSPEMSSDENMDILQ